MGEIEDHAREEARLRDAKQEAQRVEADRRPDEQHAAREGSPGHHDARDPPARADPLQDEVARDLERHVAREEHAGAEAIHRIGELEVGFHPQRREGDVEPVQVVHDVAEKEIGDEPARDSAGYGARVNHDHRRQTSDISGLTSDV